MTTLAIMKARIANELARDDLTTEIGEAINDAIDAYQNVRWLPNESRENTFDTVAGQSRYTSSDAAFLGGIIKIDYVHYVVSGASYPLAWMEANDIERLNVGDTFTGQPLGFCYYGNKFVIYPVPADAYTIRVAGVFKYAAPADDDEADNFWMVDAARLIRAKAKLIIARDVTFDDDLEARSERAVRDAENDLRDLTASVKMKGGQMLITPSQF